MEVARQSIFWDPIEDGPTGDVLFRLYNGFATRKDNRQSSEERLETLRRFAGERPATAPPHQKVRVPRYRRRINTDDLAMFPVDGGRRKAAFILKKLKEEFADAGLPPPPSRAVLDTKEKQRLQTIFEWSESDQKAEDLAPRIVPVRRVVKGSREEKEQLMDSISKEIDERESFLRDMKTFGKEQHYRSQIQWEIQDRINQMKHLDRLLCEEDANMLAKKAAEKPDGFKCRKNLQWR